MKNEVAQLRVDFPEFKFKKAKKSRWSSAERVIYYTNDARELMHELGHAVLGHRFIGSDVGLLRQERAAWTKARELALGYSVILDEEYIEESMDTYRRWLHKRSLCTRCKYSAIEEGGVYRCFMCGNTWVKKMKRS